MNSFISYSSKDLVLADMIRVQLEARGISCWIAPRNISAGATYADAIIDGITQADSLVLVLSDNSNQSRHVQAEVERAFSLSKPVFPVRISDVRPSKSLELFVSGSQWIDALAPPLDSKMNDLATAIKGLGRVDDLRVTPKKSELCVPEKRELLSNRLREVDVVAVACRLFEIGATDLDFAPVESFGLMATADPSEADQARTIQAAIKRHLEAPRNNRILNLAVYGPVGSGKIFPIRQIAESSGLRSFDHIEIQLSTLRDTKEIVMAYRSAQDATIRGKTAMLWLEGFDSPLAGIPFGWIQHLIRTMRDCEFIDEGVRRPLGSCVLSLVGTEHVSHPELIGALRAQGHSTLVSEFSTLLNGHFDIHGLNPLGPDDLVYMLSRALFLRSMLRFDKRTLAPAVLRALLTVPWFHSNARSLKAVLDACRPPSGGTVITEDSLPPDNELDQHVDARWLREYLREHASG